jgi:hypothetical protein
MAFVARAAVTDMKIGIGVNYLRALNCESWLLRDQWKERLRCPMCRRSGWASLSQGNEANAPTIDEVSEGFRAETTAQGLTFLCVACAVEVVP